MNVIITGTSKGIGRSTAQYFLNMGHDVLGIDVLTSTIRHDHYEHCVADVSKPETLPAYSKACRECDILINNAGTFDPDEDNIAVNLQGVINCTEAYGLQPSIQAIVNVVSASAHNGAEFPQYVASKGGVLAYTKWTASEVAKWGATCNSISPGGVLTRSNRHILEDMGKRKAVMDETLLGKWATPGEVAIWIHFLACINKSVTAQDILIDNGEMAKFNFVW